jgi:arginine decarboxylase
MYKRGKNMERLYKKLERYGQSDFYPFHMPGHKRNLASSAGKFPFERDITEISGFDNLHHAEGILKEAQENAAQLYGTRRCFFSVNGSTAALLSAISACVSKGGSILVARNCHKAVYHALYLRELQPVYIYPHEDSRLGINGGISPSCVERYLEEHPEVEAVLITSPTYDGIVSNVEKIAEIAHRHEVPLIVDEAHGAHFRFSEYFPVSAADLGADIVIQSFHKTLPSMTQTAVLHVCSDRVDVEKVKQFMAIYQTSSPSYILMASIDACVDKMQKDGQQMFREFTFQLEKARQRLSQCQKIQLVQPGMLDSTDVFDYDRSKLLFSTVGTSMNGHELHARLRDEFHIEMEMEAENYVLGIAAVGDTEEGFERLCSAIEKIDAETETETDAGQERISYAKMKQVLSIAQAMDAQQRRFPLEESIGKISGEFAYLYPPGIPILVPGEQISGHLVRNVRRYMEQGLEVQGLSDSTCETICVAARKEE